MKYLTIPFLLFLSLKLIAQPSVKINPQLLDKNWKAHWITHPQISGEEFGVYLFRKSFDLNQIPEEFIIHISADNRYKLFVNGKEICNGPERGDFLKWHFETINIASQLQTGRNVLALVVWNFAQWRPVAQFSHQTGLILQGNSEKEEIVNTNQTWLVFQDKSYSPIDIQLQTYYVVGPGEKFDARLHPWAWETIDFDDKNWLKAKELGIGSSQKSNRKYGIIPAYCLYPRQIPLLEMKKQRFSKIRKSEGTTVSEAFLKGQKTLTIPARSKIKILFDQGQLTTAYPNLIISNGKDSEINLIYAESLFDNKGQKGNRNEIEGKNIKGNEDIIVADGGIKRNITSLWWRTFRYVEMTVTTQEEALLIEDFYNIFTAYPLIEKATFESNESTLSDIWKVAWHTQRLCSHETYFDCPYYEQLQYTGDTRIQSLITFYAGGDTLLWRKAIEVYRDSRLAFGLPQSRYPSYQAQVIAPFSLIWITMVHDYWKHCGDKIFIKSMISCILDVLDWYELRMEANKLPGEMEWWNFIDWVDDKNWDAGVPPKGNEKHSALIALQYVYTLEKAAEILDIFQQKEKSRYYKNLAETIKKSVWELCWDDTKKMLADTPDKTHFSQHAHILGILVDIFPKEMQQNILTKTLQDKNIAQASYYYQFYVAEALKKAGLANQYMDRLYIWKEMLDLGLTTFMEKPEPSRSDCHAWSASPVYHFLSLICGIEPASPAFESLKIAPNLGKLEWVKANMPHPFGEIKINLQKQKNGQIKGEIFLPPKLTGTFIWKEKNIPLKSGENKIN